MCCSVIQRDWSWPFGRRNAVAGRPAQQRCARETRSAFSLIEALMALSVMSLAGAVLLLSVQSSLGTTIEAVDQTIADGIAQQMLHEIVTKRYMTAGADPLPSVLSAGVTELLGPGTSLFDDVSDYVGYVAQPIKGTYGETLGTGNDNGGLRLQNFRARADFFQNWQIRTKVYYVTAADHSVTSNSPTNFRMVEVTVEMAKSGGAMLPLANRKRVIAYVPPPP